MGVSDAELAVKQPHGDVQQQQQHAPMKRRPRGNFYGKHLWGADPTVSGELEYVRRHGEELIHKMVSEDENWKYVSLKQVHDVRLYTPIAAPEDDTPHTATASEQHALGASSVGRSLSSTSASSTKERTSVPRVLPGRCDFRAMTRVAGSIDTVMEILAADDDREAYWTALNTQKGLRACHMFGSRRLAADAPFPRWSQRYMATRFTKYSTKSVDVCFAEYSKLTHVTGEPRRGFIYRRSVDEGLFEMDAIKARLAKYNDDCERMYIQDWLYEVSETQERGVCKVVLTCSVYFSGDYSRSLRTEFHEFTTEILIQLRKVLSKHWKEQQGEPADAAGGLSATALLNSAFKVVKPGQSRYCSVCSASFTLLRKRHACRTCCASVCSKCSVVAKPKGSSILGQMVAPDTNGSTRECTLCFQFSDDTASSRSSGRQHFVTPLSTSLSATEHEYDDDDELEGSASLASSSRSILSERDARKLFSSSASATMKAASHGARAPAAIARTPAAVPRSAPRKPRNGSSDSTTSSKSVPEAGVVLFSELDALTLSGRVVGPASRSGSGGKRPIRTVSEDNVLHARDSVKDDDDLANFNLKLL